MVARNQRSTKLHQTDFYTPSQTDLSDEGIITQAHALYGTEAPTAIAYCALDAWFEDKEGEFRRFAGVFRRLRN
jgi:hypothetical protein